ncbi:Transcriptional regulator, LysR family [Caballeronia glathei]|jgi:DNA-binding transcriptional LysR family regulator|uniref:LysR family transcriptional regulator n=1 Tax=Caballeronia glathei TaxID=60547 RepID=A0A069PF49_9BURK|nr:LysR family transcriptional regulator [Caballeronia glathei]KDR38469.1 LysR family transcriptional regulator [Caballeronia glathei]CDY76204.1 Transcriptional regulator, LysR family [Caballeronia glathei]
MDQLTTLRVFVTVGKLQSFTRAADVLGMPRSALSRAIVELEERLRVRLLHRTTRRVELTDAAREYFSACSRILEQIEVAHRDIMQDSLVATGTLRLVVDPVVVSSTLPRLIAGYHERAPHVRVDFTVSDRSTNFLDGRYDIGILQPELVGDVSAISRPLASAGLALVATPAYLRRRGVPHSPRDLASHTLLKAIESETRGPAKLHMREGTNTIEVPFDPSITGNGLVIRASALSGLGIALLPESAVAAELADGSLIRVLDQYPLEEASVDLALFYLHRSHLAARSRIFVDFCVEFFRREARVDAWSGSPVGTAPVVIDEEHPIPVAGRAVGHDSASCLTTCENA